MTSSNPQLGQADDAMRGSRWSPTLVLVGVLVVAAAIRFVTLNRYPFEQDELYSEMEARLLYASPLSPGIQARPFYYFLQHVVLGVWPVSHMAMRFLPFVFGVAGVAVTWALAKRILGDRAAAIAAVLVAVSPWHLYISGMGRYWSLVYLLAAAFYLVLFDAYRTDRPAHYLAALVFLLLGAMTHPTFLFAVGGATVGISLVRDSGAFGLRWPTRRAFTYLWIPAVAALGAAVLALKLTNNTSAVQNWQGRGWSATLRLIPAMVEWTTPIVVTAGGLGALALISRSGDVLRRRWGMMTLAGISSVVGILTVASLSTDVYADYGVSALPFLIVSAAGLIALGAEAMASHRATFSVFALLIVLAGMAPSTASFLSDGNRFDYRPAFRRIAADAPDLPVLTMPIILQRYYAPKLRGVELQFREPFLTKTLAANPDLWAIIPVRRGGIWQDDQGEVAAWLPRHCHLVESQERPRLDYRMYRVDLYRCNEDSRR